MDVLSKSAPLHSDWVSSFETPPEPWSHVYGAISQRYNAANRETWRPKWFGEEDYPAEQVYDVYYQTISKLSLTDFRGASSLCEVYWRFIRPFGQLLGWWVGDIPSYGTVIRISFDANNSITGSPCFMCHKLHPVNRLYGTGSQAMRDDWLSFNGFDERSSLYPEEDGMGVPIGFDLADVSIPGFKAELLWTAPWQESTYMSLSSFQSYHYKVQSRWSDQFPHRIDSQVMAERAAESSIASRAYALTSNIFLGGANWPSTHFTESGEEASDNFDEVYRPQTLQHWTGTHQHTVYLPSGVVSTSSSIDTIRKKGMCMNIRVEYHKPYASAQRAFDSRLPRNLPLPSMPFPPPSLLPTIRDLGDNERGPFSRFLQDGMDLEIPSLQMDPCPPYRPWPHLTQPIPTGPRFFPLKPVLKSPLRMKPKRVKRESSSISLGFKNQYEHVTYVDNHLDPGHDQFDWSCIEGLYSMTYGPWGQELIYVRSRQLTIHDFDLDDTRIQDWFAQNGGPQASVPTPTGPHGRGHMFETNSISPKSKVLTEGLRWTTEPYIDLDILGIREEEQTYIRPGCRVVEGVKCTGDVNVPRGAITFRVFSRGKTQDIRTEYSPPPTHVGAYSPWNGSLLNAVSHTVPMLDHSPDSQAEDRLRIPGRILKHGMGRVAREGFVNAGTFTPCSMMITSPDELQLHWHEPFRTIANAKRVTTC